MELPKNLLTRSFLVLALAVVLYAAGSLAIGWEAIAARLAAVPAAALFLTAALSLVNYGLRFWRWETYLRALGVRLAPRSSLAVYLAAYVMVITPGKIGEVFKAGILREKYGVPLATGLPVVLAERLYDFLAVLALAGLGLVFWPGPLTGLVSGLAVAAAVPALVLVLRSPGLRRRLVGKAAATPLLARHSVGLDDSLAALGNLLTLRMGAFSVVLSSAAWLCECLGLYVVCRGLGLGVGWGEAMFAYAAGTLVGSLFFLPGGLGGTEATIIWLLGRLGVGPAPGATAALLIRLFTLWLAVVVGLVAIWIGREHLGSRRSDHA